MRRRLASVVVAACLLTVTVFARDQVSVQQIDVDRAQRVTVIVDVTDQDGTLVPRLDRGQVVVHAPGEVPTTSVRPFQSADGVAYVVLVDVSGSAVGSQQAMKQALDTMISQLLPNDRMALLQFGEGYMVRQEFTDDKELLGKAAAFPKKAHGQTHLYSALRKAAELARRGDIGLPLRRAIVIMSDGKNNDQDTGLTEEDVVRSLSAVGAPLYAIDAGRAGGNRVICSATLARFATVSNGLCEAIGSRSIDDMYMRMRTAVRRVYVVEADCTRCTADGVARDLWVEVKLTSGTPRSATHQLTLVAPPPPPPPAPPPPVPWWKRPAGIAAIVVSLLALAGLATWLILRSRRPVVVEEPVQTHVEVPVVVPPTPPPPPIKAQLEFVVMRGSNSGKVYEVSLRDRATVGQGQLSDLRLDIDPDIAATHCEFSWSDDRLIVRHVAPTGVTCVNGVPIRAPRALENHDVVRIGNTDMRVVIQRPSVT
jgi:VWFA-related protein